MRMRKTSIITYGKRKTEVSTIEDIPPELITEIFAKVGASSLTDLVNVKLSCKNFNELAEDKYVLQHVSLDTIPIAFRIGSLNEKLQAFLRRCEESKNPGIMYRQAVVDYFGERKTESAYSCLEKAVDLGHIGALYLRGIFLLLSDDDESINSGIKLLGYMTKSKYWKEKFMHCRNDLIKMLQTMWIQYPNPRQRSKCCLLEVSHGTRFGWDGEINTLCEACNADAELKFIYDYLPKSW